MTRSRRQEKRGCGNNRLQQPRHEQEEAQADEKGIISPTQNRSAKKNAKSQCDEYFINQWIIHDSLEQVSLCSTILYDKMSKKGRLF